MIIEEDFKERLAAVRYKLRLAKACKVEALRGLAIILKQVHDLEQILESQPGEVKK